MTAPNPQAAEDAEAGLEPGSFLLQHKGLPHHAPLLLDRHSFTKDLSLGQRRKRRGRERAEFSKLLKGRGCPVRAWNFLELSL